MSLLLLCNPETVLKKNQLLLLWHNWLTHHQMAKSASEILSQKGTNLPYTSDLLIAQINHNTGLVVEEDMIIIPNVLLEFGANDDLLDPIYPVICQVAFSQTFRMPGRRSRFLWTLISHYAWVLSSTSKKSCPTEVRCLGVRCGRHYLKNHICHSFPSLIVVPSARSHPQKASQLSLS